MDSNIRFYTVSEEPRPVRLPEEVRQWAWDSLHGKYGDEAVANYAVAMDDLPGIEEMTLEEKVDAAVLRIAKEAPIRVTPCEAVCGAGTLGLAIRHVIPATVKGEPICSSNSHVTLNFKRTVTQGVNSYAKEIAERLKDKTLSDRQRAFLYSMDNVIDAMRIWHGRYLTATRETRPDLYEMLQQVPFGPARSFREAVQAIWFEFSFARVMGNWPGIGRIDWILGDYLRKDLADGTVTLEEAREVLASLFIKGCEWIQSDTLPGSGDAQHYQNIVIAGLDEKGNEVANEVTDLVLDIVEELSISDYPITIRVNEKTPQALLEHAARVMRHGGGVVAVYNEPTVIKAMLHAGYTYEDAVQFANDGCWEVQVPGATCFGYMPFDGLQLLDKALGTAETSAVPAYASMEELYAAFKENLHSHLTGLFKAVVTDIHEHLEGDVWRNTTTAPCPVVSLFEDGCIEKAACYYDCGPRFTVRSPHIGGAPDVGNSLYAIEKLVFEEKKVTLQQLVEAMRANWEGNEPLRQYVHSKYRYYGNDSEADKWVARVLNDFAALTVACPTEVSSPVPIKYVPGVSTFGRQLEWRPARCATAFGTRKGDILAGNDSPTPGTDASGATAIIRSYCKPDLSLQTTGSALDIKLLPGTVKGENGIAALVSLIEGFVKLGGYFMQLDIMDAEILRAAQEDPEKYKTLSVRVSGWNARFVTLDKEWQEMIIERTAQHV